MIYATQRALAICPINYMGTQTQRQSSLNIIIQNNNG